MLITYAVWSLELAAPVMLWRRGLRTMVTVALIAMHVGLELLTRVGWWNVVMISGG